ncbi:MAG: aminotransferase class I/II-fold pyridoxal phosphate-dependent enzyme [Proteobacteria bacterium]|nr:aminotransferase class I/II-fold pyridoxal phosphate-dependent enzyme [Pseudomonadota bacterium]
MKSFYADAIQNLKEKNLYRKLVEADVAYKDLISFASNDYFNLSQNAEVKKAARDAIKKYGVGSGGSRYISGNHSLYTKLEKQVARMKNCDDSIVFSSGYACSIGVIPALVSEGDLIVADRLIHSCLIDGAKLSGARMVRFLHNDVAHARRILEENRSKFKKCLIITETVFSMDGDLGEIDKLLELAEEFNAILVSDDAHGLFQNQPTPNSTQRSLHLQLGTLSKAIGTLGGYVAGEQSLIDYLRIFAKPVIYSTALPASILAASIASLKIIEKKDIGKKVLKNAEYFCELMKLPKPKTAIVPIILGDNERVVSIAAKLEELGFLISAIRPPTVEKNKARLRLTFSSKHKKNQIKKLAETLAKILRDS